MGLDSVVVVVVKQFSLLDVASTDGFSVRRCSQRLAVANQLRVKVEAPKVVVKNVARIL